MAQAHVIFEDTASGERWDTDVEFSVGDDDTVFISTGSERYFRIVQHAAENIWGNMCVWKKAARYDNGHVMQHNRSSGSSPVTGMLKVSIR